MSEQKQERKRARPQLSRTKSMKQLELAIAEALVQLETAEDRTSGFDFDKTADTLRQAWGMFKGHVSVREQLERQEQPQIGLTEQEKMTLAEAMAKGVGAGGSFTDDDLAKALDWAAMQRAGAFTLRLVLEGHVYLRMENGELMIVHPDAVK